MFRGVARWVGFEWPHRLIPSSEIFEDSGREHGRELFSGEHPASNRSSVFLHLINDFNLVCGEVVAHKLVLESRTVVDFDDTANWVSYGVADVFTGQAVLERGSANSDVLEDYHA